MAQVTSVSTPRGPAPQLTHLLTKSGASWRARPRRPHQRPGIAQHLIADRHAGDELLELDDLVAADSTGLNLAQLAGGHAAGDFPFLGAAGIIDLDVQQEPVELGFGQRIGPFLLERVLRGQHEERVGQRVHLAAGA